MPLNNKIFFTLIIILLFPLNANAYYNTLLKGRVGYLNLNNSNSISSNGITGQQKISDGAITEIAFTKFLTSNIAIELGAGYSFIKTKGNTDPSKKNSNIIPLNSTVQFHLPIHKIFVPYAGVGYIYNIFQNTSTLLKIKKSGGLVYQLGMDLFAFHQLGINLDFKYSRINYKISDSGERFKSKFKTLSTMVGVTLPL